MNRWHIHIKGIVQGVGFRPFVYQRAHQYAINGHVNNTLDGVHVVFEAEPDKAQKFYDEIVANPPALAQITWSNISQISSAEKYIDFRIIHSTSNGIYNLKITPDSAICPSCLKDTLNKDNRRYQYAFTTCTHCGPRFSILKRLPFDRENTTMDDFKMCNTCEEEYNNPSDRRYYSQTNSCPDCGIKMTLLAPDGHPINIPQAKIPDHLAHLLSDGKIIAVKGIGGFLIMADAANTAIVERLRKRKNRPHKPFAVMYPSIEEIEKQYSLSTVEKKALTDKVAPIVLVKKKKEDVAISEAIAPGLGMIGVLLPYTPLFVLIMRAFKKPLIATSCNISGSPIVYRDEDIKKMLGDLVDFALLNDREIAIPQDDSVIKFSQKYQQKIVLRRSRGFAPNYFTNLMESSEVANWLALGAQMKSAFAITKTNNIFISPYLGSLESYFSQLNYDYFIQYMTDVVRFEADLVLVDQHPGYYPTQKGVEYADLANIPIQHIQHHYAHFAAVLGEHSLLDDANPILGVVWDGTGMGSDKQVWGGEFFTYRHFDIKRCFHFDYFDVLLGDQMALQPRLSALSFFFDIENAAPVLREKFSEKEWLLYTKILSSNKGIKTSSVGRIFDSIASLLTISDTNTYEGEAAMKLELIAQNFVDKHGFPSMSYLPENADLTKALSLMDLKLGILIDIAEGIPADEIAYKFHYTMAYIIGLVAQRFSENSAAIKKIAFSGGVFQNSVLIDILIHLYDRDYDLYFLNDLSPNDESISFGQIVHQIIKNKFIHSKNKALCV